MQQVRLQPTVSFLHEWRKQAKYLYLQLELLEPLYGAAAWHLAKQLHTLSDELGEDHDLALLRINVAAHQDDFDSERGASDLAKVIERSRAALQKRALHRGTRLYQREPASFRRHIADSGASRRPGHRSR